jgi:hypothetical protein
MPAKVPGEGVARPPSYALDCLERHPSEEVLERGADGYAMAMFDGASGIPERLFKACEEDGLGEGSVSGVVSVGEEMG